MNHLKPVALSEAVLMLNKVDFESLADYIEYLRSMYGDKEIDINFYQYKCNPGVVCVCSIEGTEVGKIQLVADRMN